MKNLTSQVTFVSKLLLSIIAVTAITKFIRSGHSEPETHIAEDNDYDDSLKYFHPNKGE